MKIAILGAGFSGLAVCWNLVQNKNWQIDLYDPNGIGGEASQVAAGLLHKYAGPYARLSRFGVEGEEASHELIKVAEEALQSSVILSRGLLRLALTEEKQRDYFKTASSYSDCQWIESAHDGIPGLFIKSGCTIDCIKYLQGLWQACEQKGAQFFNKKIENVSELDYDAIVIATGASLAQFPELKHLKITQVKGQLLEFAWPDIPPLEMSLTADAYIAMLSDNKTCVAGATYEKEFDSPLPDLEQAKALLMPKIAAFFPPLLTAKIINCRAGIRASAPGHLPFIGQFGKLFVITGMGSKGLLYHALYAKKLCALIEQFS